MGRGRNRAGAAAGAEEEELKAAKRGYREANAEGNREEEARWANVIGDILKRRGEYFEALKWLRIDYTITSKHLPRHQLLPTCQSLGEVFLRLDRLKDALMYQKKHLELAMDSDDLVEQQRATTQLGRTYHEMFLRSEEDHDAVRSARKYFKKAMDYAQELKENPPFGKPQFFLKEYIDAHNNIGMLSIDLENLEDAEKILLKGLKICDDEEVSDDDDGRSRLHHNLGRLYVELRLWSKAKFHIEKDISICKRIGHSQGEAKGFINFGEFHYKQQEYDEAIHKYKKALTIVEGMDDEFGMVEQINQNIKTVREAMKVLEDINKEEQQLRKVVRATRSAQGTSSERGCLQKQIKCLDRLLAKCETIFAWRRHLEFAKAKKRVARELCDKEKLNDSFSVIGESYQKLREFVKALKWHTKSLDGFRLIGNLEGQASAKINIGVVLDSCGDPIGALRSFEEGYRLAVQGSVPSVQLLALNNMHYSHMIRFENIKEAKKLQDDINNLKDLLNQEHPSKNDGKEYCSETDTEGADSSEKTSSFCSSPDIRSPSSRIYDICSVAEKDDEDILLTSLVNRRKKNPPKAKMTKLNSLRSTQCGFAEAQVRNSSRSSDNPQLVGRKRVRLVISDDEAYEDDEYDQPRRLCSFLADNITTSSQDSRREKQFAAIGELDVSHHSASKDFHCSRPPDSVEDCTSSFKSENNRSSADHCIEFVTSVSKLDSVGNSGSMLLGQRDVRQDISEKLLGQCITCKIDGDLLPVDFNSCLEGDHINIDNLRIEVACTYFLNLPVLKRCKGLLPLIGQLKYGGKPLSSLEHFENLKSFTSEAEGIEVVIGGWVLKRLMKLYIDYCTKLSETPNKKLLRKLYSLEVSEDEIVISDCGLQDVSVSPFLDALQEHETIATLDMSHNMLGNQTMEKLRQIFMSSSQKYGGLTLDLHCNHFGPTALFQICECPVTLARLEVLNLSENRLTDACSSYLSTILQSCKGLYSLSIEQCSITSRTIQKVADSLDEGSILSRLFIGNNNPVSATTLVNLLVKLSSLKRFSELSLGGIRLNKNVVDHLCNLARTSSLSALLLTKTCIGSDGANQLTDALLAGTQELVNLDLSYCLLTSDFRRLCSNIGALGGMIELNLGGNSIGEEGCDTIRSLLMNPQCSLRCLILDKCQLGLKGILKTIQALSGNESLEELRLPENADASQKIPQECATTFPRSKKPDSKKNNASTSDYCNLNTECISFEVADSDDEGLIKDSKQENLDVSCASSSLNKPFMICQLTKDICEAIASAKHLQLLDLSKNGFSPEAVEAMYLSWSSGLRNYCPASKHVTKDHILHFSVDGRKCCLPRPCCGRD